MLKNLSGRISPVHPHEAFLIDPRNRIRDIDAEAER
jgi:hypothetical protein